LEDTRYGAFALLEFLLLKSFGQRSNPKVLAKFLKFERAGGLELNFYRCAWKQIKEISELLTCRILTGDQLVNKAQVGAWEKRLRGIEVLAEFLHQMIRSGVGQMVKRNSERTLFLVGQQIGLGGKNLP